MNFCIKISRLQFLAFAASLFWLCTAMAGGKPIKVEAANPNFAAPSEELTVVISGSGFNDNDIVEFFFTGENEIPANSEISVVGSSKSNGRGTELTVKIKVKDGAEELSYDIVIRANGRRGKGTDLFSVSKAGGGGGNSEKGFQVKVTFDDYAGDTIKSDGNGSYIDFEGSGVGAQIPVEFSPPGQFTMWTKNEAIRHVFFDFGVAVDCAGENSGKACVVDKLDDDTFTAPVPCLFPLGKRFDDQGYTADDQCSGYKRVQLGFRHTVDDSGLEFEYMLGMVNGVTFDGEGDNIEIGLREESRKEDNLRIRFDANCLGLNKGDFLKITASDNVDGDGIPNDEWKIDTIETDSEGVIITTTKTACLTRKGNGKREDLVGLFDMQFGYTICILANPDAGDGVCL